MSATLPFVHCNKGCLCCKPQTRLPSNIRPFRSFTNRQMQRVSSLSALTQIADSNLVLHGQGALAPPTVMTCHDLMASCVVSSRGGDRHWAERPLSRRGLLVLRPMHPAAASSDPRGRDYDM